MNNTTISTQCKERILLININLYKIVFTLVLRLSDTALIRLDIE